MGHWNRSTDPPRLLDHRNYCGGSSYPLRAAPLSDSFSGLFSEEDAVGPELGEENVGLLDDGWS